jgi:hypothetical protein
MSEPTSATEVPFQSIARGARSGIRDASQMVIRDQEQWKALWQKHTAIDTAPPPLPAVDFSKEIVAAVFLGEKATGGYNIEITRVIRTGRSIVVSFREQSPPPGAITTQAFTQPFHLARIPDRAREVSFRRVS